jgi:hypothetical protein
MQQQYSEQTKTTSNQPELPPCCGTGCAVCVLDEVDAFSKISPPPAAVPVVPAPVPERAPEPVPLRERAQCCNTGCLICVRDYPELVWQAESETQTLQLLEAIEQAQLQAAHLHTQLNGATK